MDALPWNVSERGVDQALTLQARSAHERLADNVDGKVRFATAIVAGMAMVSRTVVDDGEVSGGEGFAEKPLHFLRNWSGHDFHLEHLRPI
jgi:hypothetical protein